MGKIRTIFIHPHASLNTPSRTYMKLDYISSLLPQTACLGKICGPRYLGPKLAKSAIFSIFFSFSNIIPKHFPLSKYQNIFPLANTFAKRENVRLGQSPTGTQMRSITALFGGACAHN